MSNLEVLLNSFESLRAEYTTRCKNQPCEALASYYRGRADAYDVVCDLLKEVIVDEKKSR
jgi:hypothetical protein